MEEKIDLIIEKAIKNRVFPGITLLVGTGREVTLIKSWGTTKYSDPGSVSVVPSMIYDIASLTKIFTYTLALLLIEEGIFTPETKVCDVLPEFSGEGRENITLWHLFTHTSGINVRMSSFKDFPSRVIRHKLLRQKPQYKPGSKVHYSNTNPMMIAEMITAASKIKFADLLAKRVIEPLGMKDTSFHPSMRLLHRIVPTEKDGWRMKLVHGEVHDESAFALGGISGHAGLFSTASDLYALGAMWLSNGLYREKRFLSEKSVQLATSHQIRSFSGWVGLGWKVDDKELVSKSPRGTYGHTGFTGTSMIICPQKAKLMILLSNRIYPKRTDPSAIREVRSKIARVVLA